MTDLDNSDGEEENKYNIITKQITRASITSLKIHLYNSYLKNRERYWFHTMSIILFKIFLDNPRISKESDKTDLLGATICTFNFAVASFILIMIER